MTRSCKTFALALAGLVTLGLCGSPAAAITAKDTRFDATRHGFAFRNAALPIPWITMCVQAGLGRMCTDVARLMKNAPEALRSWATCGGMSLTAARYFKLGDPLLDRTLRTSQINNILLRAQVESLFSMANPPAPTTLTNVIRWHMAPNKPGVAGSDKTIARLTEPEWKKLKARIDRGEPTVITLLRRIKDRIKTFPNSMAKNHQILVIGYRYDAPKKQAFLKLYDPNHPEQVSWISFTFGIPASRDPKGEENLKSAQWVCDRGEKGWCAEDQAATKEQPSRGFVVNDRQDDWAKRGQSCAGGQTCIGGTVCSASRVCATLAKLGERCGSHADCRTGRCDVGFGTTNHRKCTCKGPDCRAGDYCTHNNQCKSGWCTASGGGAGKCQDRAGLGQSCTKHSDCTTGRCDVGFGTTNLKKCTCNAPVCTRGQYCTHNHQCKSGNCSASGGRSGTCR